MTINKKRRHNPQSPKHGHEVEFNKKGRHPYKRNANINFNLEDDEDELELIEVQSGRYALRNND